MKAQTGLEYMAVLTIVIAFLIPLFYIANQQIEISKATSEAKTAVNTMVASVNTVYAQSPGSKLTTHVFIPVGYDSSSSRIVNKTIIMVVRLVGGSTYEIQGITKCNISGRLPPYAGYHTMTFVLNQSGRVILNTTAT